MLLLKPVYDIILYSVVLFVMAAETVTTTPIWWHYLHIAIPKNPRHFEAFHMYVDGGSNTERYNTSTIVYSSLTWSMPLLLRFRGFKLGWQIVLLRKKIKFYINPHNKQ